MSDPRTPTSPIADPSVSRHRVLVADDAPEVCLVVGRLLTKAGYEVATAEDGQECLDKIAAFRPHLVVVDIMMPKVHGIDVLRQLGERGPAGHVDGKPIGVIVCSARAFDSDRERAMQLGAIDFLVKPIQKQRLLEVVGAFLSGASGVPPAALAVNAPGLADAPTLPATKDIYLPDLDASRGTLKLWGTRGSISVPGPTTSRHGGNTSCMEVRHADDVVIFDAGTGIRGAGLALAKGGPRRVHVFVGHTHWDHIQGFPFFAPAYIPGFEIFIYGAKGFGKDLKNVFLGQLDAAYFPVDMRAMKATMTFVELQENPVTIGGIRVFWEYAFHPGAAICFRIEASGSTLGYLTDNEFLSGYIGHPARALATPSMLLPYAKLIRFFSGVEVLIAEAQYTCEEYLKKIGWGHTSVSNACVLAKLAGVKRWYVTHHDPLHDDDAVDRKVNLIRQILREIEHPCEVGAAYDGMTLYR
ncbi:MAG: response regulator [Phycisphaerales bacterium]